MSQNRFRIGEWTIDPNLGRIFLGEQEVRLEPKAMEVLVYLAEHAGEAVTRRELEENVWGETVVSYEVLTVTINKIRGAFLDNSRKPEFIETLSKKGYRLIAPVSPFEQVPGNEPYSGPATSSDAQSKSGFSRAMMFLVGALLVTGLVGNFVYQDLKEVLVKDNITAIIDQNRNNISIAVIPFTNNSGDPGKDYFASGMTEYLITDLSRLSSLTVISRNSVQGYNSASANIGTVGKELNVRYVLTGSVQISADKMRVSAQLADASNNIQIWADRFDRKMGDIFAVQDEITQKIISALVAQLSKPEYSKHGQDYASLVLQATTLKQSLDSRKGTSSLKAYDNYIRGNALYTSISKEGNTLARIMFQRSIKMDPEFAPAYSAIALTHIDDYRRKWVKDPLSAVDRAFEFADKAIAIDKNAAVAHWVLAYAYLYGKKKPEKAIAAAEQAIMLYPNYADAYAIIASAYSFIGRSVDAIRVNKHAMRLNPNSSVIYYANLGRDYYFIGNPQEAIKQLGIAIRRNDNYLNAHLYLAASYANLNQIDEANWQMVQVLGLDPKFSLDYWASTQPYKSSARIDKLVTDLRKAGLPK